VSNCHYYLIFERQIAKLNEEMDLLTQEVAATNSKFELKSKQFQLFLYSVHQLQAIEDEELAQNPTSTPPPTPLLSIKQSSDSVGSQLTSMSPSDVGNSPADSNKPEKGEALDGEQFGIEN
jgi:hypothetical protein